MQKTDRVHFLTGRGKLYRRDNNIVFTATDENGVENGVPKALPINAIDELYITANIETDTNTLCFLADNNTLVHLFTHTGAHRGNIYPNTPNAVNKSGFVLLQQLRAFDHTEHRLYIAKQITKGHIRAGIKNLQKYKVDTPLVLSSLEAGVDAAASIDALMGVEGSFKRGYYEGWNQIVKNQKSFKFIERSKRPPADKINALISYFNTRIYNICLSEIYKTELDPRIGYLHEPNYKSLSLHLDLAEIFKPIIGDNMIFLMLNREEITAKDFESDAGRLRFTKDAIKKIELKFIAKMTEQIEVAGTGGQLLTWRQIIRREANRLKKCICETNEYEPFGV